MARAYLSALLLLTGCNPPASEEYKERTRISVEREGPAPPIASPDSEGAIWAPVADGMRLLYGRPGDQPLMDLACRVDDGARIVFTRFAPADPEAKAFLALIGNGHVSRLKVDATRIEGRWLWHGATSAVDPALDVLTGRRQVEATIPGAGSLILNPSALPGDLVERCRRLSTADRLEPSSDPDPEAPPADRQ